MDSAWSRIISVAQQNDPSHLINSDRANYRSIKSRYIDALNMHSYAERIRNGALTVPSATDTAPTAAEWADANAASAPPRVSSSQTLSGTCTTQIRTLP